MQGAAGRDSVDLVHSTQLDEPLEVMICTRRVWGCQTIFEEWLDDTFWKGKFWSFVSSAIQNGTRWVG